MRLRWPSCKRVIPLLPPHALFKRRSGLLPLLIHLDVIAVSILTNDVDLDVLLDILVVAAVGVEGVAGARLAPIFHVVELHDPHDPLFALAESDIGHGVRSWSFGTVASVAVRVQALGARSCVSVSVRGPHRAQEVADAWAEDDGEKGVDHG